jgi:DNA-binding GntR family transcriptional regulator
MARSSNLVYEAIRTRILQGHYAPETHLREAALATDLGVSRTPVREALRRLAADGYVTFKPNLGAFVMPWSFESFSELIAVRAELAGMAARGAALHASPSTIDAMAGIVSAMSALDTGADSETIDRKTKLNIEFHGLIFSNCGNRWLEQIVRQTSNVSNIQRAYYAFTPSDWQRAVARYAEIVTALRAGDGEWAGTVFKSHFLASHHAIMVRFKGSRDRPGMKPVDGR